jgi:hypothetical protein
MPSRNRFIVALTFKQFLPTNPLRIVRVPQPSDSEVPEAAGILILHLLRKLLIRNLLLGEHLPGYYAQLGRVEISRGGK